MKISKNKKYYYFIDIVKGLAVLLIINSHLDTIYPISFLATGGAIGNAIFFAASGFCLYPITQKFRDWISSKIFKIYIPTILASIVAVSTYLNGKYESSDFIYIFVWPTPFWFVGAIVLFYILYYFLDFIVKKNQFLIFAIVSSIAYFTYYIFLLDKSTWVVESAGLCTIESNFKLIYYFVAMIMGRWIRINIDKFTANLRFNIIGCILSLISFYGLKLLFVLQPLYLALQFLNQISVLLIVYFVFCIMISLENSINLFKDDFIFSFISYIGRNSLYIYLVQFLAIDISDRYPFPFSLCFFTVLMMIFTKLLISISSLLLSRAQL